MSQPDTYTCCVRSLLSRLVRKSANIAFMSVVAFLYFITSLLINLAQLVNFILFQYTCPSLRRYVNRYLQDIILSQNTIMLEWHCNIRFRLFFANQEAKDKFGRENSYVIGNHRFQLDGLFYWLTGEMTKTLGASKAYAKHELRFMPIIGWTFYFGEFIFLRRSWKEDAKSIEPALDTLMASPYPILLLILPEGTRFTPEKYAAGMAYAREQKLDVNLKHHLLPRVKGFANSLRHLQSNYKDDFGVYQMQLLSRSMDEPGVFEPTLANFIAAKPMKVDCYIERIRNDRLPQADATDEVQAKFLYEVFEQKDDLMEIHRRYRSFPQAIKFVKDRSLWRLFRFILLNVFMTGSMVGYLIYLAIATHNMVLRASIFSLIIFVYAGIFLIVNLMQNSQYGAKKHSKAAKLAKENGNSSSPELH